MHAFTYTAVRAHQVEIEGGEGCEKLATYLSVQLGWPDKDRPQSGKTSTSKHGIPCAHQICR